MKKIITILSLFILLITGTCYAEVKEITARGEYTMGDHDSIQTAQQKAIDNAMKAANEQAGVFVSAYTKTQNWMLISDEVEMVSGHVLKVLRSTVDDPIETGKRTLEAVIVAQVDTADISQELLLELKKKNEPVVIEKEVVVEKPVFVKQSRIPKGARYTSLVLVNRSDDYNGHLIPNFIKAVRSESGRVIYDQRDRRPKGTYKEILYYDFNQTRLMAKAGSEPMIVTVIGFEPINGGGDYYADPIVSDEDAEKILEANEKFGILKDGDVFLLTGY